MNDYLISELQKKKELIQDLYIECASLRQINTGLKKENKDLKQENERLNNIINELEKFLDERSEFTNFGFLLDYLKELKENK